MNWQYFVDIIDTISPLVTLGFGIYAATNDTKPKDGKFSSRGRTALWGLIISGMITLIVKGGGLYVKIENNKKLAIEREKLVHEKDSTIKAYQLSKQIKLKFTGENKNKKSSGIIFTGNKI